MPLYEHTFLARQDVTAQQVTGLMNTYKTVIEELGGKVAKTEYWGLKSTAYKIKKNRRAHYAFFNIDAPHEAVIEMERQMRISSDILRFLTVRVGELDEKPSIQMRKQDDRERGDRGDRGPRPPRRDRDDRGFGGGGGFREEEGGQRFSTPRPPRTGGEERACKEQAAERAVHSTGAARPARSPGRTRLSSIIRMYGSCSASSRSGARSCPPASRLCPPKSNANSPRPLSAHAFLVSFLMC
jgi:small subunit ribosomal protein S6